MSQTSSSALVRKPVDLFSTTTSGSGRENVANGQHFLPQVAWFSPVSSFLLRFPQLPYSSGDSSIQIFQFSPFACHSYVLCENFLHIYSKKYALYTRFSDISLAMLLHEPDIVALVECEVENAGVPSSPSIEAIRWIKEKTGFSQERIARLLGTTRHTLYNWERGGSISDHNRQRLLAVKGVLERAAFRHTTSGMLATWLDTPRGVEGYTPAWLLEQNEIGKARLFAVSHPSPRLIRAQPWVRRPLPGKFRAGEEHYDEALPPEKESHTAPRED